MPETRLAVRASDYMEHFDDARFLGLPREELERLHDSIEVLSIERREAEANLTYLPLHVLVALHYNYAWLTFGRVPRSLGIASALAGADEPPPFLDAAFQRLAGTAVEKRLTLPACEWRLAGLLHDEQLALVYVARLRQPWRGANQLDDAPIQICGNGELQLSRAEFDPWSQRLIDNLHAF